MGLMFTVQKGLMFLVSFNGGNFLCEIKDGMTAHRTL